MGFEVLITDEAFDDLDVIAGIIQRQTTPENARNWFDEIIDAIETLGEMPARCRQAPEVEDLQADIRLLLHGRRNRGYKIYFKIQHSESSDSVMVFHVRHWAREPLTNEELEERTGERNEEPIDWKS